MDKENIYKGLLSDDEYRSIWRLVDIYRRNTILKKESSEDLIHECMKKWFESKSKFDPRKGKKEKNYNLMVFESFLKDIRKRMETDKRKVHFIAKSLDAPANNKNDYPH